MDKIFYSYIYNQLSEIDKNIIQYLSNEKSKKTDIINDYQLYIIQNKNDFIEKLTIVKIVLEIPH